jgi:hypothetical protein
MHSPIHQHSCAFRTLKCLKQHEMQIDSVDSLTSVNLTKKLVLQPQISSIHHTLTCAMTALIKPFSSLSIRSTLPILARQASTSISSGESSTSLSSLPPLTPHNPVPRRQDFPSRHPGPAHKHVNQPQFLSTPQESEWPDRIGENEEGRREDVSQAITGMTRDELRGLRKYTVVMNRVVKMTKKGKM